MAHEVQDLVSEINSSLGFQGAFSAADGMLSDVKGFIPTGCTGLDISLRGGIPMGRVVEIYGMESSGKSTLLTHIFIGAQKLGIEQGGKPGLCVLIDSETTFSRDRAVRMGLDLNYLIELGADTVEEGFEYAHSTIAKARSKPEWQDRPLVLAWDTIQAAPTKVEREGNTYAEGIGKKPRIIQEGFRRIGRDFGRHSITFIVINQMIANIGSVGMSTPGGNALRFYTSQRIQCKKTGDIWSGGKLLGTSNQFRVIKNKIDGKWLPTTNVVNIFQHLEDGIQDGPSIVHALVEAKCEGFKYANGRYKFRYNDQDYNTWYKDLGSKIASADGMYDWLRGLARKHLVQQEFTVDDASPEE